MQLALNAAQSGHLVIATMHAGSPEEAIYRMCNAVPVEAQNEVRNQLASTLAWIAVQQLAYLEKAGQRVLILTIVHGTQAIKNTIRDNKLHQLNNVMETSRDEGMFLAERYLAHYLKNRSDFTPYGKTFKPSAELSQENFYQSPILTAETQTTTTQMMHPPKHDRRIAKEDRRKAKKDRRKSSQPIVSSLEYSDEQAGNIIDIHDDLSLHKIVEKLKGNKD